MPFTVGVMLVSFVNGIIYNSFSILRLSDYSRADAEALVTNISNSYKGFRTEAEAVASFERARWKGRVRIVPE